MDSSNKICKECKQEKPISDFPLVRTNYVVVSGEKRNWQGRRKICKHCKYLKEKRMRDPVKEKEYQEQYRADNREKASEYQKMYRQNNKDQLSIKNKKYREANKEKLAKYNKAWRENNREKIIAIGKKWRKNNIDRKRERDQKYAKKRRDNNPGLRLNQSVSASMRNSLKGNKNGHHWEDLVGYTLSELKQHLERQFSGGMTWDNYGKWHLDHIRPISTFNFEKPEHIDFKTCWNLENLQPLWAKDNNIKNNIYNKDYQVTLKI